MIRSREIGASRLGLRVRCGSPTADQEFIRSISLGPNIAIIRAWYAMYLIAMHRMEESLQEIQRGLALEPLGNLTNGVMGWHLHCNHEYDQAIAHYRKTLELHPDSLPVYLLLGAAYLAKSRADDAIAAFAKATQLGDIDQTFYWLEKAYDERDSGLVLLNVSSAFDPLRSDHRFQSLMARMNFPSRFGGGL